MRRSQSEGQSVIVGRGLVERGRGRGGRGLGNGRRGIEQVGLIRAGTSSSSSSSSVSPRTQRLLNKNHGTCF